MFETATPPCLFFPPKQRILCYYRENTYLFSRLKQISHVFMLTKKSACFILPERITKYRESKYQRFYCPILEISTDRLQGMKIIRGFQAAALSIFHIRWSSIYFGLPAFHFTVRFLCEKDHSLLSLGTVSWSYWWQRLIVRDRKMLFNKWWI